MAQTSHSLRYEEIDLTVVVSLVLHTDYGLIVAHITFQRREL